MPGLLHEKLALTGRGSYTGVHSFRVLAQSSSGAADYITGIFYVPPFITSLGVPESRNSQPYGDSEIYLVKSAYIIPDTTITGTGSSGAGATAQIRKYSAGSAEGSVFSLAFDTGVDATALTGTSLGTASTSYNFLAAGDALIFRWLQGGTGLALPAAHVVIEIL